MPKDLDLVVFGATGSTGRRVVRNLVAQAPADLRWAVVGRDQAALERLHAGVPALVADVTDAGALGAVVERARVVLNLAGPFRRLGDPVVAACIEHSTHYCDISGETARVRDLIDRQGKAAERAGVKVVCFGGASSTPVDLAVLLADRALGGDLRTATAVVRLRSGSFNGGTIASMCEAVESGDARRERDPFLLGPHHRSPTRRERDPSGLRYDRGRRAWLVRSPLGVSDTRAVRYSSVLRGADVDVQEYLAFDGRRGIVPAAVTLAALTSLAVALRRASGRALLTRAVPPGSGPSERRVAAGRYRLEVTGSAADGRSARVDLSVDGDPGNQVTALCATQVALALCGPGLPDRSGVLTPAAAVGTELLPRLVQAGMSVLTPGAASR